MQTPIPKPKCEAVKNINKTEMEPEIQQPPNSLAFDKFIPRIFANQTTCLLACTCLQLK